MQRVMLKGKVHRATITDACLDYEGSLGMDPELMKRANLLPNEKVLIANLDNGNRFETYMIEGKKGEICLNGAAAHLGKVGQKVIVMCFAVYDDAEAASYTPAIVHVNDQNEPV